MTFGKCLFIVVGFMAGNFAELIFAYQLWPSDQQWAVAFERSYFEAVAVMTVWVLRRIGFFDDSARSAGEGRRYAEPSTLYRGSTLNP